MFKGPEAKADLAFNDQHSRCKEGPIGHCSDCRFSLDRRERAPKGLMRGAFVFNSGPGLIFANNEL